MIGVLGSVTHSLCDLYGSTAVVTWIYQLIITECVSA